MEIAVLGAGSWGTAIAVLTADNGHPTRLWARDPAQVADMSRGRENARYLPGRSFPERLTVTDQLAAAVVGADLIVLAAPTASVRDLAGAAAGALAPGAILVCASKGLEAGTRLTLDRVLGEVAPGVPVVLFSGPTFATEIAQGLPAAAVVAGRDAAATERVQHALASDAFRVYSSEDVIGVAVGGALKNVIAIAAGCSDGLGFGHNARAALITRGLHEMGRLATRLGGDPLTLAGLAGMGDLVLTCTGELSRNRKVGLALAAGDPLPAIVARLGHVAEGVYTARIAAALARDLDVDMPITSLVDTVLAGTMSAREAVAGLLARSSRPERG
jgi:glycerol-3-phosphate dehydrogenase (NAD(P)+)